MKLITPQDAEDMMLAEAELLDVEAVRLEDALGRVLREDLCADRPFPPFDRVTMDGVAFRFGDFDGAPLLLQGVHAAGNPAPPALKRGSCWQVMTGSIMPADCDTVVPYEEVAITEEGAKVQGKPRRGEFIHQEGADAALGALLLRSGTRIGPEQVGILASIGAVKVLVSKVPKITVLTTGDELIPIEQSPLPHQLRQSNGWTLLSALQEWGPTETEWLHVADDLGATTQAIDTALRESDLVIVSGGISKGKKDYVRPALEGLLGQPLFHGVAQRPGKPLAYWRKVVALPGNPNSTLTTFRRYVLPLLRCLSGMERVNACLYPLSKQLAQHPFLTQLVPAMIDSEGMARALTPQNSGDFLSSLSGTGYLEIPPGDGELTRARYF